MGAVSRRFASAELLTANVACLKHGNISGYNRLGISVALRVGGSSNVSYNCNSCCLARKLLHDQMLWVRQVSSALQY